MPIYEYQCDECGASFEVMQKMSDDPLTECEKCGGSLRKVLHPVAIHFKGSGLLHHRLRQGLRQAPRRPRSPGADASASELRARARPATATVRQEREEGLGRGQGQGDAEGDLTRRGVSRVERPTDEALRKAQTTLRGLVSDGPSHLPSLNLVADSIRLELEKSGQVALLYVNLARYGRLEPVFGWRIVAEILDAVAANLEGMVGSTLRRLDVVSDFTLTDDAFIVLLSPPRSAAVIADDDLAAVTRRVYERLQSLLLNDLAPGRVRPRAPVRRLGRPRGRRRPHLRAEPAARPRAGDAGGGRAGGALRPGPRGDAGRLRLARRPRAAVRAGGRPRGARGDRLPQQRARPVLLAAPAAGRAARRRAPLAGAGLLRRRRPRGHGVARRPGLEPDDLLFLGCAAGELPNAAVVAVSEFYSLNQALVPQHVVFEIDADDLSARTPRPRCARSRTCATSASCSASPGSGAQFTALELIAEAAPDFLCLDPDAGRRPRRATSRAIEVVQLLVRFADRTGAQLIATGVRDQRAAAPAGAQRRGAVLRRGLRARRHAAAAGDVPGVKRPRAAAPARPGAQALRLAGSSRSPETPVKMVTRLRPRRLLS